MKQKELAFWLKFIIIGTAVCGLIIYGGIIPHFLRYLVEQNSFAEKNTLPWLISIWVSAIPCYVVLILGWFVSSNIGAIERARANLLLALEHELDIAG